MLNSSGLYSSPPSNTPLPFKHQSPDGVRIFSALFKVFDRITISSRLGDMLPFQPPPTLRSVQLLLSRLEVRMHGTPGWERS
jgi:hypothetical protein